MEEAISCIEQESAKARDSSSYPIVIRLSGHVHTNDRLALKEIGRQLIAQNGPSELDLTQINTEDADDEDGEQAIDDEGGHSVSLASQLVRVIFFLALSSRSSTK